jgi:hypothetical protein
MDATERTFLGTDFFLTRIGMVVCLVTGIGFVVEYYYFDQLFRLGGVFWSKMLIFVIIAFNAYLLHKHKIGIYWGSALSFVSWWAAMLLGIFTTNSHTIFPENLFLSMTAILSVYILIVIIGAFILHKFRSMGKLTPIV